MSHELQTALDAIKQVQAKRAENWENAIDNTGKDVDLALEELHLKQLDALKRQVESIKTGTYKLT